MTDDEMNVVDTMEKYGGSFVKALANCFYRADRNNITKLQNTFPEYWQQYQDMWDKLQINGVK